MSLVSDLGKEWYDSSKINEFDICPRRYEYRYERHLTKRDSKESALQFGIAFHKAMELLYKRRPLDEIEAAFLDLFPAEYEEKDRTRSAGLSLIGGYLSKWRNEPFEVLAIEQAFHFPIGDFEYVGRLDLLTIEDKNIRPLDQKTTTRFGQTFELGFKVDIQITGYILGARRLTRENVHEAIVSGSRITSKIGPDSFMRKYTNRTPQELEEWEREVRQKVSEIRAYKAAGFFPKKPSGCFAYNRACQYYGICTSANREAVIESSFEERIWEPV